MSVAHSATRQRHGALVVMVALVLAPWAWLHADAAPPDLSVKALVKITSAYVAQYEAQFALLLADEVSEQHVRQANVAPQDRVTRGELFLTFLSADGHWVAVHDVAEVDGRPVADREGLQAVLAQGSVTSVARRLYTRNARYNIGSATRDFNEPTLALTIFEKAKDGRFSFSRGAVDRHEAGATLVTLHFRERERPTMIRNLFDQPIFTTGDIVIEAETGRIRHTRLVVDDKRIGAELVTTFSLDTNVKLWVPVVFSERYVVGTKDQQETTTCESRYTNYQRFDTWGKLVNP